MHQDNEFRLFTKVNNYYSYVSTYVSNNIPNIHRDLRINLLEESYSLVRNIYNASYTKGNIRMKYLNEMLVNISMIDMLIEILINLLSKERKHLHNAIGMLTEIKNMIYAWKSHEENS